MPNHPANLCAATLALALLLPLSSAHAQKAAAIDTFDFVAGTQAIGGSYQFTTDPPLVEAAHEILKMGSNTIKFSLAPDKDASPKPHSLLEVARDTPAVKTVLNLPFANYILWTYPLSAEKHRFRPQSLPDESTEMYDLTAYLLHTYSGTGKTFYLGNWEGDWHLTHLNPDYVPSPEEVANMIAWVNTRQQAVDKANRDTPHKNVQVYYYLEVNRVVDAMQGKVRLTNDVLPHTPVDFVSYSSYDALTGDIPKNLTTALDYIASKLPPKRGIPGKRVFIGEYGFPAISHTPQEQDSLSRTVIRTALQWGCPFALYWELYNNEVKDGKQRGFWMIDNHQVKQPVYFTHEHFYAWARRYVSDFQKTHHRLPTRAEFGNAGSAYLEHAPTFTASPAAAGLPSASQETLASPTRQ